MGSETAPQQVRAALVAGEHADLKTAMGGDIHRGFESHALRSYQLLMVSDHRE